MIRININAVAWLPVELPEDKLDFTEALEEAISEYIRGSMPRSTFEKLEVSISETERSYQGASSVRG